MRRKMHNAASGSLLAVIIIKTKKDGFKLARQAVGPVLFNAFYVTICYGFLMCTHK